MTVELSSFKIGKNSGCKPETFLKKYICIPSQMT